MNLRKIKNTALIIGLIISFGFVGGVQQETIPLLEGTIGMAVGAILLGFGTVGREDK